MSEQNTERLTPVFDEENPRYTPAELMSYTLPYVVSFMNLDYQETGKFVGTGFPEAIRTTTERRWRATS